MFTFNLKKVINKKPYTKLKAQKLQEIKYFKMRVLRFASK